MKDEDFSLLVASIKQAGDIRRGESKASRSKSVFIPDIPKIRGDLGLTQSEFAMLIGVSSRTLQNWEQKRREPDGPAKALLMVAARNPKMVLEALHG